MTGQTQALLDKAFSTVRSDLAAQGITWDRAWYRVKFDRDSRSASLLYADRPAGAVQSSKDGSGAGAVLATLRAKSPDATGRTWNQVFLSLHADGRQEAAFDYPVPPPDPHGHYTEADLVSHIAECLRHDLTFHEWTEGWLEAGPERVPFLSCRNGPDGRLQQQVQDCNGLYDWLERLWQVRLEAGNGPWGRFVLHLLREGDRVETEFRTPAPGARPPEPPPLPAPARPLDELLGRIVAAERAELDDMCRRMEEISRVRTSWKRSTLTASRDEGGNLIVDRLLELTDGRTFDDPVEDEVEDLFIEVFDRLDGGDDPSRLAVPGLKVKAGDSPRFTLTLTNDRPK